ncbi:Multidrug resistance-associated protein 1 [Tetrabaena socialis]|uniref:Multidrug resistance-associated protein 1 n=1 Tax=Tetrabaena socialis TaxID=47790 RepID=A0A2J8ABH4_9CHLO|nr:Multidrug resistance-associated protein 1 [Tetrabaena socialis]|eukprot:PNH09870.1 Multidrug resistance-associated protein 1 [Tetrabaena socialis]
MVGFLSTLTVSWFGNLLKKGPTTAVWIAPRESLASGAAALGMRLQRAVTRRRDVDLMQYGSPYDSPRAAPYGRQPGADGGGAAGAERAARGKGAQAAVEGERVSLLGNGGSCGASDGTVLYGKGAGDRMAGKVQYDKEGSGDGDGRLFSVVVADESASEEGSSSRGGGAAAALYGKEGGGGGDGGDGGGDSGDDGGGLRAPFSLAAVELRVRPGQLVCVVGRVGCGKSSLLSAALGEMEAELGPGGVVGLGGRVAYVAQQAWVMNATLLENVTMGRPLDEGMWARCVEACALGPDLELLPAGRDTEIGEKGVNLSGGQKQRLALARAMYQGRRLHSVCLEAA